MLDVFLKHQIRIAHQTLRMSDAGVLIMGGMTKDQARAILERVGYTQGQIRRIETGTDKPVTPQVPSGLVPRVIGR